LKEEGNYANQSNNQMFMRECECGRKKSLKEQSELLAEEEKEG